MLACARTRRRPFRRVRRFRGTGTRCPHRRCEAEGRAVGILRHRVPDRHPLQAAAGRSHRTRRIQAVANRDRAAPATQRGADRRSRPRLGYLGSDERTGRLGRGRRLGSALHPLHLGHDRPSQRRRARQRRSCRRAQLQHGRDLRLRRRRRVLGGIGCRLGGRPLLHRLRAAHQGLHHGALRGQAGSYARRRRHLARHRRTRRQDFSSSHRRRSGR